MTSTGWNVRPSPNGNSGIQQVDQSSQGQGDHLEGIPPVQLKDKKDLNWDGVNSNKRELTFRKNFLENSSVYENWVSVWLKRIIDDQEVFFLGSWEKGGSS